MDIIEKIRQEGTRRRLSELTIVSYTEHIRHFFDFVKKDFAHLTKKDVSDYLIHLSDKKLSGSTMNVTLSSIKFMLKVMRKNWRLDVTYSRKPRRIPVFLSKLEVKKMLFSVHNRKHYLIMALLYSAGLRVSELTNLKVKDISISEGYGFVRNGKGGKDRIFVIAKTIRDELNSWIYELDMEDYIFTARNERFNRNTIYVMVKYYAKKAGIKKNVHPHTLRHSFATHLIENNYQLETVQNVLGHESPSTTQRYIHAVLPRFKVESPLDTLKETQAAYC